MGRSKVVVVGRGKESGGERRRCCKSLVFIHSVEFWDEEFWNCILDFSIASVYIDGLENR